MNGVARRAVDVAGSPRLGNQVRVSSMNNVTRALTGLALVALYSQMAFAYIGPGSGLSAIGTVIAVVSAFFFLIVGFVWYPFKRLIRKKKVGVEGGGEMSTEDGPKGQLQSAETAVAEMDNGRESQQSEYQRLT